MLRSFASIVLFVFLVLQVVAQNALFIPPMLEGTDFDLQVQSGTTQFFSGINTPTYGVNGNILAPTLSVNKGDVVTFNVTNNLTTSTTMHWHGLHVPAMDDGGPHQIIEEETTWSPQFEIKNKAGTFWYHPHGEHKTDLQVSKGLAGLILVRDAEEEALALPRTYGVDDFPLILQTKSFDILHQIQIASQSDTTVMVNATINAMLDLPAQVVRFRLLNGSSNRTFFVGFSNDMTFHQIATDGGLKESPYETNRLRLSPGERSEILINLSDLEGDSFSLISYGSELPTGIIGAAIVGDGSAEIPEYSDNPLNGLDFTLLQLTVISPTPDPVTTIPSSLVDITPWSIGDIDVERTIALTPQMEGPEILVEGPFGIDGVQFNMDLVNNICQLNDIERWTITNQTLVAHPFHIHDVQFYITDMNGEGPPPDQQGWKDVVLVMPMQSVSFITKFETFADPVVPYMYHCHLLHHEDEGMMGSFIVVDPNSVPDLVTNNIRLSPNPVSGDRTMSVSSADEPLTFISIRDLAGHVIKSWSLQNQQKNFQLSVSDVSAGMYIVEMSTAHGVFIQKIIIQ